jgi:hypothetical protein
VVIASWTPLTVTPLTVVAPLLDSESAVAAWAPPASPTVRARADARAKRRSLVMSKSPWWFRPSRLAGGVQSANVAVLMGGICDANCALVRSFIE